MDAVIECFNKNSSTNKSNIEFEIKILLDKRIKTPGYKKKTHNIIQLRDQVLNILQKLNGRVETSQTINFIKTYDKEMFVKQLHFINGVQDKNKKTYYIKKNIIKPFYMLSDTPYKITVNKETVMDNDINEFDIIRFRSRYTVFINTRWKLDLTFIKETRDSSINNLKVIRDRMFSQPLNPYDTDWDYNDRVEIELEYIDSNPLTKQCVSDLLHIFSTYQNCIDKIAGIIKPASKFKMTGIKQLGNNPIELTKKLYNDIRPKITDYMVTEKIDGIRSMLIIYPSENLCHIINNKTSEGLVTKNIKCDAFTDVKCIILDTESVDDKYYIFDIICYESNIVVSEIPFIKRLEYINLIAASSKNLLIDDKPFLYTKHFIELSNLNEIRDFYAHMLTMPYTIDGLIILSKTSNYVNTINYKWKPKTTIDFIARRCPNNLINQFAEKSGKTLYLLFCGISSNEKQCVCPIEKQLFPINQKNYEPILFKPSSDPLAYLFWFADATLDSKVVELIYTGEWEFIKVRDDRVNDVNKKMYYGNNFKVAESIWMSYKNPVTLDYLCQGINTAYFKTDSLDYFYMRKFNNYVKKEILKITDTEWVIDLASGKGQDLNKYVEKGFKNIMLTDNDLDALCDIIDRKHKIKTIKNHAIYIKQLNLLDGHKINTALTYQDINIPNGGVKTVICNLALHYIIPTKVKLQNFVNYLDSILAADGLFIFTAFNKDSVLNLFNESTEWNRYGSPDSKKPVYSIKNKTKRTKLQIEVLLPFSNGEYYNEVLINTTILNDQLAKKKIRLIKTGGFDTYLESFAIHKNHFHKELRDIDIEFISLYQYYIYKKD